MGGKTQIANIKWDIFQDPAHFFPLQRLATSALLYDWSLTDSDIDTTGSRKLTNGIFCQKNVTNKMKDTNTENELCALV